MKRIIAVLIIGVVLTLLGCQSSGSTKAPGTDLRTPEQLVAALRAAHGTTELSALEGISHFDGVDAMTREGITDSFKELLARKIAEITVEPFDPKVELEYSIAGKTYRPNLAPEGRIRVSYGQSEEGSDYLTSTTFLFGKANGQYRLAFSASASE